MDLSAGYTELTLNDKPSKAEAYAPWLSETETPTAWTRAVSFRRLIAAQPRGSFHSISITADGSTLLAYDSHAFRNRADQCFKLFIDSRSSHNFEHDTPDDAIPRYITRAAAVRYRDWASRPEIQKQLRQSSAFSPSVGLCLMILQSEWDSGTSPDEKGVASIEEASKHIIDKLFALLRTITSSIRQIPEQSGDYPISDESGLHDPIAEALVSRLQLSFKHWNGFAKLIWKELAAAALHTPIGTSHWSLVADHRGIISIRILDRTPSHRVFDRVPPPISKAESPTYGAFKQ